MHDARVGGRRAGDPSRRSDGRTERVGSRQKRQHGFGLAALQAVLESVSGPMASKIAPRLGLVARWQRWLVEKPVQANIVQAGGLMLGGDYIAQRIEHNGRSRDGVMGTFQFDVPRAGVLCAFVPFSTVFYLELWKLLDRRWPLQVARQSAAKAMTSSVFGGSLMTASFFAFVAVGQTAIHRGMPASAAAGGAEVGACEDRAQLQPLYRVGIEAVQEKWGPAMQIGGGFWFVCNFCNFQFAPPSMRILIMSGQSLFWNTLLSLMQA